MEKRKLKLERLRGGKKTHYNIKLYYVPNEGGFFLSQPHKLSLSKHMYK